MKKGDALIILKKYTQEDDCLFCQKYGRVTTDKINFAPLLNRALYNEDYVFNYTRNIRNLNGMEKNMRTYFLPNLYHG